MPDKKPTTREQVFEELVPLFCKYLETQDARTEQEMKEQIFAVLEDAASEGVDYKFELPKNGEF